MTSMIDFANGTSGAPTGTRTVAELANVFGMQESDDDRVVYRTYVMEGGDTDEPELRWSTTVIEAGEANGRRFMTRGHVHLKPERGEWMMTLGGSGELRLKRPGKAVAIEAMQPGSVHLIDGSFAHRVVNTGAEPLVFVVVWLSDCGHDYDVDF